jgi:streptomycin 6-kinase
MSKPQDRDLADTIEAKAAVAEAFAKTLAPRKSPPTVLAVARRHQTLFQRLARNLTR